MSAPNACLPVPASVSVTDSKASKKRRRRRERTLGGVGEDAAVSFEDISTMNADEYLSRVVEQAKRLPEVFVAGTAISSDSNKTAASRQRKRHLEEPPIDGCAASLSYLVSNRTRLVPAPSPAHLPIPDSQTWVNTTLDNFVRLRDYLTLCQEQGIGSKDHHDNDDIGGRLPVPLMKDRAAWHTFCVGIQDAQGNEGAYFDDDNHDDEDDTTNNNLEEGKGEEDAQVQVREEDDKNRVSDKSGDGVVVETEESPSPTAIAPASWKANLPEQGYTPDVRLLLQLDQVMVRKVLAHLSYYVREGWSITKSYQRAAWIYALLARLERPIHRDDACTLYGLLKRLMQVRADLPLPVATAEDNDSNANYGTSSCREQLARINVLIAIIAVYFEQGGFQSVFTTAGY